MSQLQTAKATCQALRLDGLILVGGTYIPGNTIPSRLPRMHFEVSIHKTQDKTRDRETQNTNAQYLVFYLESVHLKVVNLWILRRTTQKPPGAHP